MNKFMKNFAALITILSLVVPFGIPQTAQAGPNLEVLFENGDPQGRMFNELDFKPGDTVTRWAKITNKTTSSQAIVAKLTNYTDNNSLLLGDQFDVVIKEHGASVDLYSGTMTGLNALSEVVLDPALAPNVQKQYDFSVTFRPAAGNPYQENTLSFDIVFQIQGQDESQFTISGMKFNDKNGNSSKDEGDSGLPGWTIVEVSQNPVDTLSVDSTSLTGTNSGSLPAGQYLVKVSGAWTNRNDSEELFDAEYYTLDGWTTNTDGTTGYAGAGADEGDLLLNNGFANWGVYNSSHSYYLLYTQAASAPINFSVFDGDAITGVKNPGWYSDNNGSLSVELYSVYDTAITDNNGDYHLLVPDNVIGVRLYEVQSNGWTQTYPESGYYSISGIDDDLTGYNFGNHSLDQGGCEGPDCGGGGEGGIIGKVFNDANNNGTLDGEAGLEGWVVYLDSNDNGALDSEEPFRNSDGSGNYAFLGLGAGVYVVRQVNKSDWTQTLPTVADGGKYTVTVGSATITDRNFGNYAKGGGGCTSNCGGGGGGGGGGGSGATISGQKFNDENRNGQKDTGEPGLPNWTIYLDLNNNNLFDNNEPFALTDTNGNYIFSNVSSGIVGVRELQQFGWTQTYPTQAQDYEHVVNVAPGLSYSNLDFGNGQGQVLGTSTPGITLPEVAGAITTLPKTGIPPVGWLYLAFVSLVGGMVLIRRREV